MIEELNQVGRYKKVKKLGEGSYGVVYKGVDTTTDKLVALKKIKIFKDEEGIPANSLREIGVLKNVNHPNIIKLLDVIYIGSQSKLYLVFEYMDQTLGAYLEQNKKLVSNPYITKVARCSCLELHVPDASRNQAPPSDAHHPPRPEARQLVGELCDRHPQTVRFRPGQTGPDTRNPDDDRRPNPLVQGA